MSVFFQVVDEFLRLLGQPPLLSLLLLEGSFCFLALVDLHSSEAQTQEQCLQGQDVKEKGDVVQSLRTDKVDLLPSPPKKSQILRNHMVVC